MLNFTAGQDVSLLVPFKVDGEYITPDAGSVSYSVRNTQGDLIGALTDVSITLGAGVTDTSITIPASYNSKSSDFEIRSVIITFKASGHTHTLVLVYRLSEWANLTANGDTVRGILGLSEFELPDADINIMEAYASLSSDLGGTTLADALTSGTLKAQAANRAVALKAAVNLCVSIPMRALRSERSGDTAYDRYPRRDWSSLGRDLSSELESEVDTFRVTIKEVQPTFLVGSRTDVITGQ